MIPYTTIPFVSAFFLVLVGVLIAHLLWYRSRDEHRQVAYGLHRKNEDLHASLQTQMGEYVQLQEELAETRKDRVRLQEHADQIQTLLQQREQEVQHLQQQLSHLQHESGKQRHRLERIERQLTEGRQRLQETQQQASAAESSVSAGQRKMDQLQQDRQNLEAELCDARRQVTELKACLTQEAAERAVMSQQQAELADLQAECQRRCAAEERLRQQLTETQQADQKTITQLRHEHQQIQRQRDDLQVRMHDLQRQQVQLQAQLRSSAEQDDSRASQLQATLQHASAEIEQLQRQHNEALATEASLRELVTQLRDELACRVERLEILQEEKEQALAQAGDERKRRARVEQSLEAVRGTLEQLQADNETLACSRQEALLQIEELNRRAGQPGPSSRCPSVDGESAESSDSEITFSFHKMQARMKASHADEASTLVRHPLLGDIYPTAPRQLDDLKQIAGIADVLEEKLNQLGIYTYRQIMQWNDAAVGEVTRLLCLEDRVERDDWVGQARSLYHRHYRAA